MITSNIMHRVFHLARNNISGTCFTIEHENKQYIITAKHLVSDITHTATIQIYHERKWKNINLSLLAHCPDDIDISVFVTNIQLTPSGLPCEPSAGGLIYGQDVYFLGFPYGINENIEEINRGFPIPFVKKAILSCMQMEDKNRQILYLDGHNNPGFSGGPVIFSIPNQKLVYKICGVISGFRYVNEPIYHTQNDNFLYYRENTGIIISYGVKHAIDEIIKNPIGFQLTT